MGSLGASWKHCAPWVKGLGCLWPSWGPLGSILRASSPLRALFGASFGPLRRILRPSWSSLGALLGRLGALLGPLGPSWDDIWGLLGRLGPFLARKAENPKNIQNQNGFQLCLSDRLFAADGLLRRQDGSDIAQDSPERGPIKAPRRLQDGPRALQETPRPSKTVSRWPQDGPRGAPRRPKRLPRGPPRGRASGCHTY